MSGRLIQRLGDINCGPSEKTPINIEPALMTSSFYELMLLLMRESTNEGSMPSEGISKSLTCVLNFILKLHLEFENIVCVFPTTNMTPIDSIIILTGRSMNIKVKVIPLDTK